MAGPLVLGYLLVATVLALVTAWVPGSGFSMATAFAAACPAWLAAYHVPLSIHGAPLGVLPVLPTILIVALIARSTERAARRLGFRTPAEARRLVLLIGGSHVVVGSVLAVAVSGGELSVDAPAAAIGCGLVSSAAATIGLSRPCGLLPAVFGDLDESLRSGLRAGVIGLLALVAGGMAVTTLSLALSFGAAASLFARTAPGAASGFGLVLLCVAYLPNAAVAAMSFLAGPGFSIGLVELTVTGLRSGPVPSVPLLAALPSVSAGWWPVGFLLPAAAGALVGWWVRRVGDQPQDRLRAVGVAAAVTAVGCFVLGELAGGRLGAGIYDPVQLPAGLFAVAAFCWIAVPGSAVAWLAGPRAAPGESAADDGATPGDDVASADGAEAGTPAVEDDAEDDGSAAEGAVAAESEADADVDQDDSDQDDVELDESEFDEFDDEFDAVADDESDVDDETGAPAAADQEQAAGLSDTESRDPVSPAASLPDAVSPEAGWSAAPEDALSDDDLYDGLIDDLAENAWADDDWPEPEGAGSAIVPQPRSGGPARSARRAEDDGPSPRDG